MDGTTVTGTAALPNDAPGWHAAAAFEEEHARQVAI
jgi:hypothetical protein